MDSLTAPRPPTTQATYGIIAAVSVTHLLNDLMQALLPAVYPIIKTNFALDFSQIGLITLAFQLTASILQPVVGLISDKHPMPLSLPLAMGSTLAGLVLLAYAPSYSLLLVAAIMVGFGSAVFHPEAARVVRLASAGRYGFAHSCFQVGGNSGAALGPLLAAFLIVPYGQTSIAWFALIALTAIAILSAVARWYRDQLRHPRRTALAGFRPAAPLSRARVGASIAILVALIFSKQFYIAAINTFLVFFVIERFGLSVQQAQLYLFAFLAATAVGVMAGGPLGDRYGRRMVIWASVLGALPFTLALPYASLFWTGPLLVAIGLVIASATSSIIVYAQDLMPMRVGMISGLFFGLAFGMGGLGAAVLGELADRTSIGFVYGVVAFLPALGLLCWFLPKMTRQS